MLGADAFGPQVTNINLYVYDRQGTLVLHKTQSRQKTVENNYAMDVDLLPGTYHLLAWCEGESLNPDASHFVIADGASQVQMTDIGATLPLSGAEGELYSDRDITPLYHGLETNVEFPDTFGIVASGPVFLTKDTNHITVLLQNQNSVNIDKGDFDIAIEASNSVLLWNNSAASAPAFDYKPWSVDNTEITTEPGDTEADRAAEATYYGVKAELTTGRLLADRKQYLRVTNRETGETIIRIPLIDYLLLVKGKYSGISSDQDFLDAYDDFTIMFFVDDDMTWIKSRVIINGWRIVPPQDTIL